MFDTMTITKVGTGFLGALLIFLLGSWAAQGVYSTEVSHDEEHIPGYSIALPEPVDTTEEVVEVAFADVYATASADDGSRLWRQCSACHSDQAGVNGTGPYLAGVVGRPKGAAEGFNYSDALASLGGEWTPENISNFLASPRDYAPGTTMSYRGMSDIEDRANLVAYLATLGN